MWAETDKGMIGPEIGYLLQACKIPDATPDMTKWKRLFNAFVGIQNSSQMGNHVIVFIKRAMNPIQYTQRPDVFRFRRDQLNTVLALCGIRIGDDGQLRWGAKAQHLDEALARANRLHAALVNRQVHYAV